jgi:chlorite dismutase
MAGEVLSFKGGSEGQWKVLSMESISGEGLAEVSYLKIDPIAIDESAANWVIKGLSSNMRYTERSERDQLVAIQAGLGRPEATLAALIPIRKTEAWWLLAQDERRQIFEETSQHTSIGLRYLPGIARKLYHSRDLGEAFDFLTWFEFSEAHEQDFNTLVATLRATQEWKYVDREIDIRLRRV